MRQIPIGTGVKAGWTFTKLFRLIFYSLFFIYLFVTIILTAIEAKDFNVVIKELGEEFWNPLQTAQQDALEMQNKDFTFLQSIWMFWGFYFNLFKIYLWIWVLKLPIDFLFKGTTSPMMRVGMAIFLFYTVQVLFSVIYLKESPNMPFTATMDIFKGLTHSIQNTNLKSGPEKLLTPTNTCNTSTCVI